MRETVGMALSTLLSNRLRSLLTMLGIVIGNASVITLVGVGRGAQNLAEGQLSNLGANVLFVVPGSNDTRRQGIDFPKTLVLEDAKAIAEQVPSVQRVAPQITLSETVRARDLSANATVSGITPSFLTVRRFEMAQGRFISEQDLDGARSVAVLGPDIAQRLLPGGSPLGKEGVVEVVPLCERVVVAFRQKVHAAEREERPFRRRGPGHALDPVHGVAVVGIEKRRVPGGHGGGGGSGSGGGGAGDSSSCA
jgi:putative ABC transport system permease protein